MGYDVSTVEGDRELSKEFAKKYHYDYLFDKETGEFKGDATVYFRMNIWGMAKLRDMVTVMANKENITVDSFLRKFSWNDGEHVTPDEIDAILSAFTDERISQAAAYLTSAYRLSDPEEAGKRTRMTEAGNLEHYLMSEVEEANDLASAFAEFKEYLGIASHLGGCKVW